MMTAARVGFVVAQFCVLLTVATAWTRDLWPREVITHKYSSKFIELFNNRYNVKGREKVYKAYSVNSGISNMNLSADSCPEVHIGYLTTPSFAGIVFFDRYANVKEWSNRKNYRVCTGSLSTADDYLLKGEPIIIVFNTHVWDLVVPILKDLQFKEIERE